jgi:outer membrane scaffolding protein for murein synthesis (MipA/OmpV family)
MLPSTRHNSSYSYICLIALAAVCAGLAIFSSRASADSGQSAGTSSSQSSANNDSAGCGFSFIGKLKEWHVEIGAGAEISPKFEGSQDLDLSPVPWFSAEFGDRVTVNLHRITVKAYEFDGATLSGRLGYDPGRSESDASHPNGGGDVGAGANLGVEITYEANPLKFEATLDRTVGGSNGLVGTLNLAYVHRFGQFRLTVGPSVTWADGNYMGSYFSVNDHEAARSGLSKYDADGGFKRVDLEANLSYAITDNWIVRSRADLGYLLPAASDSPIVEEKLQPSFGIGLTYRF